VTQLTLFDATRSAAAARPAAATAEPHYPPVTDSAQRPEQMTRATFIARHHGSFVRYRGKRTILGVQCLDGSRILPLPANSQKNGRLMRPVDDVLGDIHRELIEAQVTLAIGRPRIGAHPPAPPEAVLADYPDLARSVSLGVPPAALAKLDAQPTSYRQLDTGAPAPRTLAELKRQLVTGAALTRFSETDPRPLHLVVRRVQGNAFVSGPVGADLSLTQRYADGLWHHYEPASRYTFGPRGFDTALQNGRTVSYRYGHLPVDQPCPAADLTA
jgi:hypothetical protein